MRVVKLSDLVIDKEEDLERIIGKPVIDVASGKRIGTLDTAYFQADGTVSHAVVKTSDGMRVIVKASNLYLNNEDGVVWIDTSSNTLLEAIREALKGTLEIIELYSARSSSLRQREVLLKTACEHLANALQLLQPHASSHSEQAPRREIFLSKNIAERAEPA